MIRTRQQLLSIFRHSSRVSFGCPALDEIELLRVELAEEAGRDEAFDESGGPAARFPGGLDPNPTLGADWVDGEEGHGALVRIGLGEHAARLRFVDVCLAL